MTPLAYTAVKSTSMVVETNWTPTVFVSGFCVRQEIDHPAFFVVSMTFKLPLTTSTVTVPAVSILYVTADDAGGVVVDGDAIVVWGVEFAGEVVSVTAAAATVVFVAGDAGVEAG